MFTVLKLSFFSTRNEDTHRYIHHCTAAKLLYNSKHLRLYIQITYVACVVHSYTINSGPLRLINELSCFDG